MEEGAMLIGAENGDGVVVPPPASAEREAEMPGWAAVVAVRGCARLCVCV